MFTHSISYVYPYCITCLIFALRIQIGSVAHSVFVIASTLVHHVSGGDTFRHPTHQRDVEKSCDRASNGESLAVTPLYCVKEKPIQDKARNEHKRPTQILETSMFQDDGRSGLCKVTGGILVSITGPPGCLLTCTYPFPVLSVLGFSLAPRVFTKISRVVSTRKAEEGVSSIMYQDDWLIYTREGVPLTSRRR